MNWLKTFFEETPGFASAMRLIYIIGSLWLMAFMTACVFYGKGDFKDACKYFILIFGLLSGGKVGQKYLETKTQNP